MCIRDSASPFLRNAKTPPICLGSVAIARVSFPTVSADVSARSYPDSALLCIRSPVPEQPYVYFCWVRSIQATQQCACWVHGEQATIFHSKPLRVKALWRPAISTWSNKPSTFQKTNSSSTVMIWSGTVSYTHLRAHETVLDLVCRLLLEKKNKTNTEHWTHHNNWHITLQRLRQ